MARRSPMPRGIRMRGPYQYQARLACRGYPPQTKTFNTLAEAEAWLIDVKAQMNRGIFVPTTEAERTTLKELIERYQREVTPTHKGSDSETYRLNALARLPLSLRFVATLKPADFANYRDERLKGDPAAGVKGKAPATVDRELCLFQQVIEQARREWGIHLPENPLKLVRRPKFNNERNRRLTAEEETVLLAKLEAVDRGEDGKFVEGPRGHYLRPLVIMAIETAARQSELARLRWEHVHLDRRFIHFPETKNGHARDVPLTPRAVAVLKQLPRSIDDQVFPLGANAIKKAWTRAVAFARRCYLTECEEKGVSPVNNFLENLHFHDLRHEGTSRLADKLELHELTKVTGHRDPSCLMRYYHPRAEDLARKLG